MQDDYDGAIYHVQEVDDSFEGAIYHVKYVDGGPGDQHNLGWYATQAALEEAHPTAEAGDWAIVGATDTVWIWDTDTNTWKDSDQKGQVTSVNNQTGAVTLGINDVAPTQTGKSGYVLGTDGFVAGWVKPEIVQRSALPQASEEEVDNIYEYVGTTDANYTNGYFYKCVSDGQNPATYSWTQVNVQPAPSGLPDQTGQSGKFLTTDGTDASWSDKPLVNTNTQSNNSIIIGSGGTYSDIGSGSICLTPNGYFGWISLGTDSIAIGSKVSAWNAINIGGAGNNKNDVVIGRLSKTTGDGDSEYNIAIGTHAQVGTLGVQTVHAIQLGSTGSATNNSDSNTFKVANANGNFEIMSADGTVPTARLTNAINKYSSMPTASADYLGQIVQFTGTTDATYTHGYIYECVSDGGNPATYSWTAVSVQAGGSSLPSQTGNSGKFLTTDGTDASWSDKPLVNKSTYSNNTSVSILGNTGTSADATFVGKNSGGAACNNSVYIGYATTPAGGSGHNNVVIGCQAHSDVNAYGSVQLGTGTCASGTFCVALSSGFGVTPTNYRLLNSDGTIPKARLANVATVPATTPTLVVADWSSNTQTITVTGVTASNVVLVSPAPSSASDYASAGIICTAQGTDSLTFDCQTVPSNDITLSVVIL